MLTKEWASASVDMREAGLRMALAILIERVRGLPKEDREDLHELSKAIAQAESDDELESAFRAMHEILEQAPMQVRPMDTDLEFSHGLQRWIDFASSRLVALRKKAGLTQQELAKRSGIPQSHISRLEAGKHSPSSATLEKLTRALGVPFSEIDPSA